MEDGRTDEPNRATSRNDRRGTDYLPRPSRSPEKNRRDKATNERDAGRERDRRGLGDKREERERGVCLYELFVSCVCEKRSVASVP
jgi:hypothetical protein